MTTKGNDVTTKGDDVTTTGARPDADEPAAPRPIVAVFNASSDTVEMLRASLEAEGFHTVTGHVTEIKKGELDLIAFVEHHRPAVIVYDVSPPYDANWNFLRLVRSSDAVRDCRFVVTTTNKPALDGLVGATETFEIIGKPYDLDRVVDAVREALGEKP